MKRLAVLMGLVVVLAWWTQAPGALRAAPRMPATAAASQTGETNPYYICEGRTCVAVDGCGISTCSNDQECGACDPYQRAECESRGSWYWDDWTCTCYPPVCNPADEWQCINNWGAWDPGTCTCSNECNPGQPVPVHSWSGRELVGCVGCLMGLFYDYEETYYVQYCRDGRVWNSYSVGTGYYTWDYTWDCGFWCWLW